MHDEFEGIGEKMEKSRQLKRRRKDGKWKMG
jgi:hypothetical protein